MRSPDRIKDQTYFLSRLKQEQLARATFPIGEYEKHEIRTMAEKLDLPTKSRKDSQGICFLGKEGGRE
jgi:tRNA-specific 2-thiouridylase